jgi:hypothetical protein
LRFLIIIEICFPTRLWRKHFPFIQRLLFASDATVSADSDLWRASDAEFFALLSNGMKRSNSCEVVTLGDKASVPPEWIGEKWLDRFRFKLVCSLTVFTNHLENCVTFSSPDGSSPICTVSETETAYTLEKWAIRVSGADALDMWDPPSVSIVQNGENGTDWEEKTLD